MNVYSVTIYRTCFPHAPIQKTAVLPDDNTQDYDYYHESKGTGRVWSFTDDVCGVESQKVNERVHFTECVKLSSSPTQKTPQPCHQVTTLRIMIITMKTKVLVEFEASRMVCVELKSQKAIERVHFTECVKLSSSPTQN